MVVVGGIWVDRRSSYMAVWSVCIRADYMAIFFVLIVGQFRNTAHIVADFSVGRCNVRKWLFVPRDLEMGNLGSTAVQSFVSETREMFKFIAYLKFASARGSVCVRFAKMEHLAVIINERHYTFPSTEYYSRTHTRCFRWACVGTAFRSVCWCGRENWGNSRHTHP